MIIKKYKKKILTVSFTVFIVGLLIAGIGAATAGFDSEKLNMNDKSIFRTIYINDHDFHIGFYGDKTDQRTE